jgi:hypothetical protein
MTYIRWDRPRLWAIRVYKPRGDSWVGGYHYTVGIVAESVDRAIEAAQKIHPTSRIESVNDKGAIDYIVNVPTVGAMPKGEA